MTTHAKRIAEIRTELEAREGCLNTLDTQRMRYLLSRLALAEAVVEAGYKVRNEANGSFGMIPEAALRKLIGNTNYQCCQDAVEGFDKALAAYRAEPKQETTE